MQCKVVNSANKIITSHQIGTIFHCQGGHVDNVRHKF